MAAFNELTTRTGGPVAPVVARGLGSSDRIAPGGFAPGAMLGQRFRIIGLLGVGGMGEVYRADDLKLGQPVALKFLPHAMVTRPSALERFYAEVRTAREISHPNVCRVYDVDEIDGRHFLSMEFIDGEDLASLLKRIGHLPAAKLLEIAQQLCAGLAAAHKKGVIHRDLKPANVMVDGRGHARITDFGLAVPLEKDDELGAFAGTPLYMAPEQLAGQGASTLTDIYALGLVLYEVCTGKVPFKARTLGELRVEKATLVPPPPSELARDVDPNVERVLLRCLDRDPRARPGSVLHVAASLPGGNPLAAAIAAGDTPSPEMVAASAGSEGLTPGAVAALLTGLAALAAIAIALGSQAILTRRAPLQRPPDAFVERARQIAEQAGYGATAADSAFGIGYNDAYLQSLEARDRSPGRWNALSPNAVRFWYRQSPGPLKRLAFSLGVSPMVTPSDPPLGSGDVLIMLDGGGRLVSFTAVPMRGEAAAANRLPAPADPDLFRAAGLETSELGPAPPWLPRFWADKHDAWQILGPDVPDRPRRVEWAIVGGRPVEFHVVFPWDRPDGSAGTPLFYERGFGAEPKVGTRTASLIGIALTAVALFGGLLVARRNLRLGRGDRRGASRLVLCVTVVLTIAWVLDEHHVADAHEWYLIVSFAGRALVIGGIFWWTYVAFEPYVRRRWPSTIVSWSRLVTGNLRDPLIGRDVLIGCTAGALITCLLLAAHLLPSWLGRSADRLATPTWHAWLGPAHALSLGLQLVGNALLDAFTALFVLVLLRMALGRDWLAMIAAAALLATPDVLLSQDPASTAIVYFAIYLIGVLLLMRVGLLAVIALRFTVDLLQVYPIVYSLSAWYAGTGLAALIALGVISGVAARISLLGSLRLQRAVTE
jgi:eukaryotic-like serine/threonine-protein kinase